MPVKAVDAVTLRDWLNDGSATLVDVREPAEYRAHHIAKACSIPLGKIDTALLPTTGRVVIHCLKGARGASACEKLIRQNPGLEIYNLAGGIRRWPRVVHCGSDKALRAGPTYGVRAME